MYSLLLYNRVPLSGLGAFVVGLIVFGVLYMISANHKEHEESAKKIVAELFIGAVGGLMGAIFLNFGLKPIYYWTSIGIALSLIGVMVLLLVRVLEV